MAEFTGIISPGDIDTVYSRTAIGLGTRLFDTDGNEYIFLKGVASTVQYSWVTYNNEFDTTLLATAAIGPVAIAQAAIVANKYGWYLIWGSGTGKAVNNDEGTFSSGAVCGRTSADGSVGGVYTAGDLIYGAFCRSAMEASSANTSTKFQICYPSVDAQTAGH